jgi:hydroxymethylglutaryl-CoA reductase (NADPH)
MSTDYRRVSEFLRQIVGDRDQTDAQRLRPHFEPAPPAVPGGSGVELEVIDERWSLLPSPPESRARVADPASLDERESYCRNIENFIGTVKLPVGVIGPIRINGLFARGDFYVPLATTEAALVASHSRGARLITEAGGCTAALLNEGVTRAPGFAFATLTEAGMFVMWATASIAKFREVAEKTTSHGKLTDMRVTIEGNHVYLGFEYTTGDASGQNMVTIATDAICQYIHVESPVKPRAAYVEANLSGDKKATTQSFLLVRGKKVSAEVVLPAALVEKRLHTTPKALIDYWRMSALGGVMSGSIGVHGHYANGLAALYIACGQDPACVAESAVGVTRFEVMEDGGLYAAVTLPNLMIGTVGGGTNLPSQSACLDILGLRGPGKARALAEVCASLALAGELSITGALAAGHFTRAHQRLARGVKSRENAASTSRENAATNANAGEHTPDAAPAVAPDVDPTKTRA